MILQKLNKGKIDMKRYKILRPILLILILISMTTIGIAVPIEEWSKTFGGTGYDIIFSINQISDGGYILAGKTSSYGSGGTDAWLIKTDSLGNKKWSKTFGGTGYENANSVQQTKDGGYIVAGDFGSSAWLIKTDPSGNRLWDKLLGTDSSVDSVQQTIDGGYILAGSSEYGIIDIYDIAWLIKTDSFGNEQWSLEDGNQEISWFHSVRQTYDGGYIISGSTGLWENTKAWLVKTDSLGKKQWSKMFGETIGWNHANDVRQTKDGGYILACDIGNNAWLIKTDPNGNKLWSKMYSASYAQNVGQTIDGGYILSTKDSLIKTDSLGNKQWSKTFTNNIIQSILQTKNGEYVIAGSKDDNGWLTKLSGDSISQSNLLKNPGFETSSGSLPIYWNKIQTGKRAIFTYPETGKIGKSVAIKYTTKENGKVALWQQHGIVVSPNSQYKLSGYMKLQGVTGSTATPRPGGASIRVSWYKSDGKLIKTDVINKKGTIGWTKYEAVFKAPSNAVKAIVGGDLFDSAGKVWFDDLSFVKI